MSAALVFILCICVFICSSDGLIRCVYLWEHKHADADTQQFLFAFTQCEGEFIVPGTEFSVLLRLTYTWPGNLFIDFICASLLVETLIAWAWGQVSYLRVASKLFVTSTNWWFFWFFLGFHWWKWTKKKEKENMMLFRDGRSRCLSIKKLKTLCPQQPHSWLLKKYFELASFNKIKGGARVHASMHGCGGGFVWHLNINHRSN